mmetsp:Transcript_25763/g.42304  ORF Transcript_25763/g.42304 Transcript_25763/m.42304 type:complete len:104 (+) Transcript_25763:842-1153(+)
MGVPPVHVSRMGQHIKTNVNVEFKDCVCTYQYEQQDPELSLHDLMELISCQPGYRRAAVGVATFMMSVKWPQSPSGSAEDASLYASLYVKIICTPSYRTNGES